MLGVGTVTSHNGRNLVTVPLVIKVSKVETEYAVHVFHDSDILIKKF